MTTTKPKPHPKSETRFHFKNFTDHRLPEPNRKLIVDILVFAIVLTALWLWYLAYSEKLRQPVATPDPIMIPFPVPAAPQQHGKNEEGAKATPKIIVRPAPIQRAQATEHRDWFVPPRYR